MKARRVGPVGAAAAATAGDLAGAALLAACARPAIVKARPASATRLASFNQYSRLNIGTLLGLLLTVSLIYGADRSRVHSARDAKADLLRARVDRLPGAGRRPQILRLVVIGAAARDPLAAIAVEPRR